MIFVDQDTKLKFGDHSFNLSSPEESTKIIDLYNCSLKTNADRYRYDCPIKINGRIALIEQKPWIQNKSVRENIIFGNELIPEKYNRVIELSQLGRDLDILEGGDLTEIGEKGVNLSGGQRARISIARALYSDFDIVLMDDPLSALDAHVKNKIFSNVCLKELEGKTRILVTHAIDYLHRVDRILVMDKSKIIFDGTFDDLKQNDYYKSVLERVKKEEGFDYRDNSDSSDEQEKQRTNSVGSYLSKRGRTITNDENKENSDVGFKLFFQYFTFNKLSMCLNIIGCLMML